LTQVFAVLAGLFHVGVFAMESLPLRRPAVQRAFGGSRACGDAVRVRLHGRTLPLIALLAALA
jgi:hypothetical protein